MGDGCKEQVDRQRVYKSTGREGTSRLAEMKQATGIKSPSQRAEALFHQQTRVNRVRKQLTTEAISSSALQKEQ